MTQVVAIADPYHFERNALYIGQGATMMSRAGIFRASGGIAVDMNNRVFKLPSFHGIILSSSKLLPKFLIEKKIFFFFDYFFISIKPDLMLNRMQEYCPFFLKI